VKLFGTPEQMKRFLPAIMKAEMIGALAYTEAEAGSDIASVSTTARKDGDVWVLNGVKDVVANAIIADVLLVLARMEKGAGSEDGMSLFIVEKGARGLDINDSLETMGLRGVPVSVVKLENCEAKEIVGGEPGKGYEQLERILKMGTVGIVSFCVGVGTSCMEKSHTACEG